MENITLFTDASFADYGDMGYLPTAGGAFWAKGGSDHNARQSGKFQITGVKNSTEAEMMAALQSIGFLLENPDFLTYFRMGSGCRLVLVTDCTAIQKVLMERKGSIITSGPVADEFNRIFEIVDNLGFFLKVNWVKAHASFDSPRNWVNHFCDRHAKLAREEQVQARIRQQLASTQLDLQQVRDDE